MIQEASMKLSDRELYELCKARLLAEKRALAAQQAGQAYRELLLEVENRYGLVGKPVCIDFQTGEIKEKTAGEPQDGKHEEDPTKLATVASSDS